MPKRSYYRPKVAPNRRRINWASPTPEDIAAGLSQEQRDALLTRWIDRKTRSLAEPVPGWREALVLQCRATKPVLLTSTGEKVREVLAAQGIETRSAIDPKGRGPEDESPVAKPCARKEGHD
jgi:hypothetical protein